ncbi:MAG: hypothetical protein ACE5F6_04190 [Anaerolineae bacterium]
MQKFDYRAQLDIFQNRNVQIGAAVGLIVGLLLGWFVLGWWIAPVRWVDAGPGDLHKDWQRHWVAMTVDSYLISGDSQAAEDRLKGIDAAELGRLFGQVEAQFEQQGADRQARGARQLADLLGVSIVSTTPQPTSATAAPAPPSKSGPSAWQRVKGLFENALVRVCAIVLVVFLVILGGVIGFFRYREGKTQFATDEETGEQDRAQQRGEPLIGRINVGERAVVEYHGEGPGFEQTVQVFRGLELLGSCGLRGVSTLSDSGRVAACSVWLYEPQAPERSADTCFLAGRRVYQNEALRTSLTHNREPGNVIPAEPGQTAHLEHDTLEMTLRVLQVEYTDFDEQYIGRLIVELEPAMKRREARESPFDSV